MRLHSIASALAVALASTIASSHVVLAKSHPVAILGNTYADWAHVYGLRMKNTSADLAGWHPCPNHTSAQLLVGFLDGRAMSIDGTRCEGASYPIAARKAEASMYLPRDAMRRGHVSDTLGASPLYYSATLAREVSPNAFQDCDPKPVKRGLFVLDTHAYQNTGWVLVTGTCTPDS